MVPWRDYEPADPEDGVWDVLIIGAGMAGGFLALALARMNLKVLVVERGVPVAPPDKPRRGARLKRLLGRRDPAAELAALGRWNRPVTLRRNGRALSFYPPMGNGPGGSSAIYGAALERFRREDFDGSAGQNADPKPMSGVWPIGYDDFLAYYRHAEAILGVRGGRDATDPDDDADLRPPPPLSERDTDIFEAFETAGLSPYRVHVGIDYLPGCGECLGALCARDCKAEGASRGLKPAVMNHGAKLLTGFTISRLGVEGDRIDHAEGKLDGRNVQLRAKIFILAAGALASPAILLASTSERWPAGIGNDAGLVGRGLMFHVSEMFAVWPRRRGSSSGPTKTIASRALDTIDGRKLGGVASVGLRVSASLIANFLAGVIELNVPFKVPFLKLPTLIAGVIGERLFRNAALLATITEDFAYPDNRVTLDADSASAIAITYETSADLSERVTLMRRILRRRLPRRVVFLSSGDNLNYGHPSGTCRFGATPSDSVLDAENRVHGVDNLYVADASCFPSSGGTNPSLTVAANALRVADIIGVRMGANDLAPSVKG